MARWRPDAQGRLAESALDLFARNGFDVTTVEEIAEGAGLSKRTFFRHFTDKREVLFAGSDALSASFLSGLNGARAGIGPWAALAASLEAITPIFRGRHPYAKRRAAVISASPELQERELVKLSRIASALRAGLLERGEAEPQASLASEAAVAVFRVAFERWVAGPEELDLDHHIHQSLEALRHTLTPPTAR